MVRLAISESLYELVNSSADPAVKGSVALEAKASSKGKKKKITSGEKAATKKTSRKKDAIKKQ